MTSTKTHSKEQVRVGSMELVMLKGGSGAPVLDLHGEVGHPGWTDYHQALSEKFTVYSPQHPGYDESPRPEWASSISDVAHLYLSIVRALNLDSSVSLLGFSMGGWIAAEMAAMSPSSFKGLVLVGAAGVRPRVGEIAEVLMVSPEQAQELSFHDQSLAPDLTELSPEALEAQWRNREMASRLCWKPYLHNPVLPEYLRLVKIPSLIVWGRQDRFVPIDSAELYHEVLEGSSLHVIDQCGHLPQVEKPREFLDATVEFLSGL